MNATAGVFEAARRPVEDPDERRVPAAPPPPVSGRAGSLPGDVCDRRPENPGFMRRFPDLY